MITKDNLTTLLTHPHFGFIKNGDIYKKEYPQGASIEVNIMSQKIKYAPLDEKFKEGEFPTKNNPAKGFVIHRKVTLDFSHDENFVCLVCTHLLLAKGYEPKHIVMEPAFEVGHVNKPSYGDILVFDKEYNPLVLIENKTFGAAFSTEWNKMLKNGGQLFSYLGPLVNKCGACENLVLFAADFEDRLIPKSHIIKLRDSEKRLSELENPITYGNTQGKYFDVWSETYIKTFETKGLFEDDIEPYSVGKLKYTINDIEGLSHAEIRPIYNEFATILRNHAITDFEHSFYTLIDLFLCKITDERNNPEDLQFYYKGITRDTPKEYCARLLNLYQRGKKELFGVDVVNKNESDILKVFKNTNRVINGLFAGIKELFEEVKYYNIKKFNFIDVENKEEFELNFQILIKIAALIQDIKLSDSETNHFFGDLFEGLLSKNVHQTEGQFFTPLPLVNFIIKSLPQFPNSNEVKVIDYACGAGHFLTEFVKSYPQAQVYGIEKSQPLSQVAKIATIINGAKDSHIVFKDSLSILNTNEIRFQGFDKESFDCIIANPPYSVKGFLTTLTENDRKQYDLIRYVDEKSYETNKSIECFFIERAKFFLKQDGLMGIVLPASILTTGNLYKQVRELLFANFNILAIVKLGHRTFGSTGTNTIILFAQKVMKNSKGLLDTFIEKNDYTQYLSHMAIDSYIQMQGYDKKDFFAFMQDEILNKALEDHEIFAEYNKSFKPKSITKAIQKEWFKNSKLFRAELKERTREYKKLFIEYIGTDEYRSLERSEYRKQFISFAKEIERDKLNTFIQIGSNNVVILKSTPDEDDQDTQSTKTQEIKFLGYDWSNRKGDEGIKYITSRVVSETEESEDDKDAEVVNAINSIKFIETPLYNPNDDYDKTKYAFAIRKHIATQCNSFSFNEETNQCLDKEFSGDSDGLLSYARLIDLVDFSKASFDKAIKIKRLTVNVDSKYPLVKLSSVVDILSGGTPDTTKSEYWNGDIPWLSVADFNKYDRFVYAAAKSISEIGLKKSNAQILKVGDVIISARGTVGALAQIGSPMAFNQSCYGLRGHSELDNGYLYYCLTGEIRQLRANADGTKFPSIIRDTFDSIRIPLPPIEVQREIITECEEVDTEFAEARNLIINSEDKINALVESVEGDNIRIGEIGKICMCKRILKKETNTNSGIPFYKIGTFGRKADSFISKELYEKYKAKYPYPQKGQILISAAGTLGKSVAFDGESAYFQDSNIVWIDNDESIVLNQYLLYALRTVRWKEYATEGSVISRIYNDSLRSVTITVPTLPEQKKIVKRISILEAKIVEAKEIMAGCSSRKQAILDKYLRA